MSNIPDGDRVQLARLARAVQRTRQALRAAENCTSRAPCDGCARVARPDAPGKSHAFHYGVLAAATEDLIDAAEDYSDEPRS